MGIDGVARGTVQSDPATFMEARREADYAPLLHDVFARARAQEGEEVRPPDGPVPDLWREWALRCLYELDTPGVETRAATFPDGGHRVVWLLAPDGSWARAMDGPTALVHHGGPRRLWDGLERVRRRWEEHHRFPLHSLRAELGARGGLLLSPVGT